MCFYELIMRRRFAIFFAAAMLFCSAVSAQNHGWVKHEGNPVFGGRKVLLHLHIVMMV